MSVTSGQWAFGENSNKRDIILWADHRAHKEAAEINASGSMVLKYVGETMSLEMWVPYTQSDLIRPETDTSVTGRELPKILWLKRHMPAELFECVSKRCQADSGRSLTTL